MKKRKHFTMIISLIISTLLISCQTGKCEDNIGLKKFDKPLAKDFFIGKYKIDESSLDKFKEYGELNDFEFILNSDNSLMIKNAPIKLINSDYYDKKNDSLISKIGEWNLNFNENDSDLILAIKIEEQTENSVHKTHLNWNLLNRNDKIIISIRDLSKFSECEFIRLIKE